MYCILYQLIERIQAQRQRARCTTRRTSLYTSRENVNHNAELSIEVDRRIRNAWCSFRKYSLELYDRPSAPLELKIRLRRAENAVRLRHVEPAHVPLRHAAPSPPQVLDSLRRLAKAQLRRPPDFLSGQPYQDGK